MLAPRARLGIALAAIGAILLTTGIVLAISGTSRVLAWFALRDHVRQRHEQPEIASDFMRDSGHRHAGDPRRVVPACDPADPQSVDLLASSLRHADTASDRRIAGTAARLAGILAGKDPGDQGASIEGADRSLLDHLAALRAATAAPLPEMPDLPAAMPPQIGLLRRVLEERLAAGFNLGDARAVTDAAGRLLTLAPRHPAARELAIIIALPLPGLDRSGLLNAVGSGREREPAVQALLRRLLALHRHDPRLLAEQAEKQRQRLTALAVTIASVIPPDRRTAEEEAAGLLAGNDLAALAKAAATNPNPAFATAVAMRAQAEGRLDLVRPLLPAVAETHRPGLELLLAVSDLDLTALKRLLPDPTQLALVVPRLVNVRLGFDQVSFQLVNPADGFQADAVEVEINNQSVVREQVRRIGPLFQAPIPPGADQIRLSLKVGANRFADRLVTR